VDERIGVLAIVDSDAPSDDSSLLATLEDPVLDASASPVVASGSIAPPVGSFAHAASRRGIANNDLESTDTVNINAVRNDPRVAVPVHTTIVLS
jgi:hypothetical protein